MTTERTVKQATSSATRTFVLDTSVLLSDPRAVLRFDEHDVVVPLVVVTELEGKRHHPELGYFARQALRLRIWRRNTIATPESGQTHRSRRGDRRVGSEGSS